MILLEYKAICQINVNNFQGKNLYNQIMPITDKTIALATCKINHFKL